MSDIAVIEHFLETSQEWIPIAYIGPDRAGDEFEARAGDRFRVRYLDRDESAGKGD